MADINIAIEHIPPKHHNHHIARFIWASLIFFVTRLFESWTRLAVAELARQPVLIMNEGTKRVGGREAQHANITAARITVEAVRSWLGCEVHGKT